MRVQVESRTWAEAWERVVSALGRRILWEKTGDRTIAGEVGGVNLEKLKMTPGVEVFPEVDHIHPWID